eukprot:COSAG01_NODE_12685_length_1700_cov_1.673329_1_plen_94_part_10
MLLQAQLDSEDAMFAVADLQDKARTESTVVILDRGALDVKAFMRDAEWSELLASKGLTEAALLAISRLFLIDHGHISQNQVRNPLHTCIQMSLI